MSGKYKDEKDKSNGDFLWPLCPEKCRISEQYLSAKWAIIDTPTVFFIHDLKVNINQPWHDHFPLAAFDRTKESMENLKKVFDEAIR